MNCGYSLLVGAFDDRNEAEIAYDELKQAGFDHDNLGFSLRGSDVVRGGMITDATGTKDAKGAVKGAATGAVIGGALGAAAAATIPVAGPFIAGGILTAAMGGAVAGTAIGGIFGALRGLGASEEEAVYFQREFESGKALVFVRPGDRYKEAADIIERHGGYCASPRDGAADRPDQPGQFRST
jgi:hypothetical protein